MPRPRKKYASIGGIVRILVPCEFIRCGYPLSIKDVMQREYEGIEEDFQRVFAALEKRPEPRKTDAAAADNWLADLTVTEQHACSATVHGMLCAAIAAYRLEKQNFGGKDRIVVEGGPGPLVAGQEWVVVGKRLAKTGKRYPSWSGYTNHSGEWDYEPGGLEGEQTHCVYTIERLRMKVKILARNCEIVEQEAKN